MLKIITMASKLFAFNYNGERKVVGVPMSLYNASKASTLLTDSVEYQEEYYDSDFTPFAITYEYVCIKCREIAATIFKLDGEKVWVMFHKLSKKDKAENIVENVYVTLQD